MLLTGNQKRERLRDGRRIYIGSEEVRDVTEHPAFRNTAETICSLYDYKADPANRDLLSYEEDGDRHSLYWLRCRTREDLARRTGAIKAIAQYTFGMIGRSPDHVAGMLTGLAMNPDVLERLHPGFGQNLTRYYEYARNNDLYIAYAVIPPTGKRDAGLFPGQEREDPSLRVVREDDEGVVLSGMKMLATGAVFADEVWIGNLTPIDDKFKSESITCAIPVNTPGVSFWSRQPYGRQVRYAADYPLSSRFDETDSVLVCEEVRVPWERVFLHNNGSMSRGIYVETPSNAYANHQSNVRFWAKMGLIVGVCSRICQASGIDRIPAVREQLGRLASLEATIGAMVHGQIDAYEEWPKGYASPNRRFMYAALNWCQESYSPIIDSLRTLIGGTPLQMPASIDVLSDPELKDRFERWWRTPSMEASDRMKLYKLAWDLVGSEFAGRHQLYEKFYAGNSIVVRNQSDREAPWDQFHGVVDALLASIGPEEFE
ncbi:4-hydroxyphenylacetate 3-hydroxylase N-terminal domain-containing protein [Paraburkholderia sediminicola]|uniref:4-hydroxyphenylacetate 3-hydroxylase family protein n=1 Tax=Paraburkholderia sediminicola TaxID=458836 RepID=UPI0038BC5F12